MTTGLGARALVRLCLRLDFHEIECNLDLEGLRPGNCQGSVGPEKTGQALEKGRVYRTTYPTRDPVRADIFDYIGVFYNSRRRHWTVGQVSPMEFERIHAR